MVGWALVSINLCTLRLLMPMMDAWMMPQFLCRSCLLSRAGSWSICELLLIFEWYLY